MHRHWPFYYGLVFSLILALPAQAQVLNGRIQSNEDKALAFASVQAIAVADSAVRAGSLSRIDGTYRLILPEPGRWRMQVRYLGHAPGLAEVQLEYGQELDQDFILQVEAIELEAQEVRAERDAAATRRQPGVVALEGEELARLPAFAEADPVRALQLLPGVSAASDFSSGLYIRGGSPDQNLFLLDGVPVYNPTHAFGLFSSFHPDLIDDLLLYKGAYPATYGGRLGSVLELRSRRGPDDGIRGSAGLSTLAGRLLLEGGGEEWRWVLAGRRTWLDPLLDALRKNEPAIPAYAFDDVSATLEWRRGTTRRTARAYRSRDALLLQADPSTNFELDWGNRLLQYEERRTLGGRGQLVAHAWYSRYRTDNQLEVLNTPASFDNGVRDSGGAFRYDLALDQDNRFSLGAEGRSYDFFFAQTFNRDPQVSYEGKPWEGALWAERGFGADRSDLRLGLRGRYFGEGERWLLEPRASMARPLRGDWDWRAAAGLYHQVVQLVSTEGFSAADFYLPLDGSVAPSRSGQLAVGIEGPVGENWRLSVDTYASRLEDLVFLDPQSPVDQNSLRSDELFLTGGSGWSSGLELFAQGKIGAWSGWAGYTLAWTRRRFDGLNDGQSFPPKYDRRNDFSLTLGRKLGAWEFDLAFVLGSGQAFTPAAARYGLQEPAGGGIPVGGNAIAADRNSSRLLPYHRLDLAFSRPFGLFGLDGRFRIQAFNAYSRRNDWFIQFGEFEEGEGTIPITVVQQLPIIPSLGVEFAW